MSIDIPKDARAQAIASIQRYLEAYMEEKIGNIAAGALRGYFLEEIAPLVSVRQRACAATAQRSLADVARGLARRSSNDARITSGATRA